MAKHFIMKKCPEGYVSELDKRFEARKNEVLNTKSEWKLAEGGRVWYVSASDGNDLNDGTENAPIKTLERVMELEKENKIVSGDVVLFKRGDEWHIGSHGHISPYHKFVAQEGVTYSAYGEGAKPRMLGSYEADNEADWTLVDGTDNLYKYNGEPLDSTYDVGLIVLNDGEGWCLRVLKEIKEDMSVKIGDNFLVGNGFNTWLLPPRPFKDQLDLIRIGEDIPEADLMYYHNWDDKSLYVLSKKGNPGALFDSIEIGVKGNAIVPRSNTVFDNLCVRYAGSHGIGCGDCKNLTVRNCEVSWIGGSIQFITENGAIVRYGNTVEIFGACDGYYVYNNYMHNVLDCGPTVQWIGKLQNGRKVAERNIEIHDNVLWDAKPEIWLVTNDENTEDSYAYMENCRIYDNLVTAAGQGFTGYFHQKTGYVFYYGGENTKAPHYNCSFENNIFWNSRRQFFVAGNMSAEKDKGFVFKNNTFIHPYGGQFGIASNYGTAPHMYENSTIEKMIDDKFIGENNFLYTLKEGQSDPALEFDK